MTDIISTPESRKRTVKGTNQQGFEYYETKGRRPAQEDALTCVNEFSDEEALAISELSPAQIGHRLWTAHHLIDTGIGENEGSGSTASTTVYDGKGHLITATLADAVSFVTVYDKNDTIMGVMRLNTITHKPGDAKEQERIVAANAEVSTVSGVARVNGMLNLSRALGDKYFNDTDEVICADSNIDIISVEDIGQKLGIQQATIGRMQIITTCDGFTDGAGSTRQNQSDHEAYLLQCLQNRPSVSGTSLSQYLADKALKDGSRDNISIAIQTIIEHGKLRTEPVLIGVYDGHGGAGVATQAAKTIGGLFKAQCCLSETAYQQQLWSVQNHAEIYQRDHGTALPDAQHATTVEEDSPAIIETTPAQIPEASSPLSEPETPAIESDKSIHAEVAPSLGQSNPQKSKPAKAQQASSTVAPSAYQKLFEHSRFNQHLQALEKKREEMSERREFKADDALFALIAALKDARQNLESSADIAPFIDDCMQAITRAEQSELKNHRGFASHFQGLINATNWIASFFSSQTLIQTDSMQKVSQMKSAFFGLKKETDADEIPDSRHQNKNQ